MKLIAIAAASIMLMAGAAQAQVMAPRPTMAGTTYGEVGYTSLKISESGVDVKPGVLRGIIGFNFSNYVAFEGMAGFGVTKDSTDVNVLGNRVTLEGDVQHMFGVYVKPRVNIDGFELFGRLGYADTRLKATARVGAVSVSDTTSGSDWSYGLGANFNFSPRAYVGIDYMQYYNKDDTKIEGVTLGLGYRF
jgi:outer membrane autotransporter protein